MLLQLTHFDTHKCMWSNKLCMHIYFTSLWASVTKVFSKTNLRLNKYPQVLCQLHCQLVKYCNSGYSFGFIDHNFHFIKFKFITIHLSTQEFLFFYAWQRTQLFSTFNWKFNLKNPFEIILKWNSNKSGSRYVSRCLMLIIIQIKKSQPSTSQVE